MHEVSKILKEKRKAQKLTLEEVSKKTKIHINILKKIEESKFSDIPPAYLKGFIKIYATFLNLPYQELLEKLELLNKEKTLSKQPFNFKISIVKKAPRLKMVKIKKVFKSIGIIMALFLVFFSLKRFYAQIKEKVDQKRKTAQTKKVSRQPSKVKLASKKDKRDYLEVVIRAKRDTYLQVKVDGETVFREILIKGFSESWKAKKEVRLWIGDAGALDIEVNGKLLPKLGKNGEVLREVIITSDSVKIKR